MNYVQPQGAPAPAPMPQQMPQPQQGYVAQQANEGYCTRSIARSG